MSIQSKLGIAGRLLGIGIAVCVAGSLAWAGVERDIETGMSSRQDRDAIKQVYRVQAAVLNCQAPMTIFYELFPQPASSISIPPPEARGGDFNLAALDTTVDRLECRLDTRPQLQWLAVRDLAPRVAAAPAQRGRETMLGAGRRQTTVRMPQGNARPIQQRS